MQSVHGRTQLINHPSQVKKFSQELERSSFLLHVLFFFFHRSRRLPTHSTADSFRPHKPCIIPII